MNYSVCLALFKSKKYYRSLIRTSMILSFGLSVGLFYAQPALSQVKEGLSEQDGPYVLYGEGSSKLIQVSDGKLETSSLPKGPLSVMTENGQHRFEVALHPIKKPDWSYKSKGDMLVLSDPHADFESFYSILRAQQVIGDNYQWIFGKNQLVIIGDVFDRGVDVLPIFWLMYKLEAEAEKVGGKVHFLFGNHEEMILRENLKYNEEKYKALKDTLGIEYRDLWSMNSELGRWLLSRNTMEKIGDKLFVHAGLSSQLLTDKWTIPAVNDSVRTHIFKTKAEREQSPAAKFLFGSIGPLWYRGMVRDEEKYEPLAEQDLQKLLVYYGVKEVYVGHTIFPEVTTFYANSVFAVNVNNRANREKGRSRGLLIRKGKKYLIYDNPTKNIEIAK